MFLDHMKISDYEAPHYVFFFIVLFLSFPCSNSVLSAFFSDVIKCVRTYLFPQFVLFDGSLRP